MSRIANSPVEIPSGVEIKLDGDHVSVKQRDLVVVGRDGDDGI